MSPFALAAALSALVAKPVVQARLRQSLEGLLAEAIPSYTQSVNGEFITTDYTQDSLLAAFIDDSLPYDFGRGRDWCRRFMSLAPVFALTFLADQRPVVAPGSPTHTTTQAEAAPDGPIVNEESASSPRQHPAAISEEIIQPDTAVS